MSGTEAQTARVRRLRSAVLAAAVLSAGAAPLAVLVGAGGTRARWFSLHVGFDWLALRVAPGLAIAGLALGALALSAALVPPRRGVAIAVLAVVVAGVSLGGLGLWRIGLALAPPVHDVDTDWLHPILFSPRLMLARGVGANPIETNPVVPLSPASRASAGQYVAVVNARTCPAATPVVLAAPPATAYARARAAIRAARLALVTDDPAHALLEATRTSSGFGFKDDVAIQVKPHGAGSRIDLRASARQGVSDFGRDCRLVVRLRRLIAR